MSEQFSEAALFNSLREMEASIEDPLVTSIVLRAKDYSDALKHEHDPDVAAVLLEELNDDWEMFKNMPILCTGVVTYDGPDGEAIVNFLEDVRIISNGFTFSDTIHPVTGGRNRRIRHHFFIPTNALLESYDDQDHVVGMAELDDITLNPEQFSLDRARAWLNEEHPGLMEQIDIMASLELKSEKQEHFMALKKFHVKAEAAERPQSVEAIKRYLASLYPIDRDLPYIVKVDGIYTAAPETDRETLIRQTGVLIVDLYHFDVCLRDPSAPEEGYGIGISVDIHASSMTERPITASIPLHAINRIQSERKKYYPESF